jgi:hypothetical protein
VSYLGLLPKQEQYLFCVHPDQKYRLNRVSYSTLSSWKLTTSKSVIRIAIRIVQSPTCDGVPEVHAAGNMVSSAVLIPIINENPVTEAVIVPSVTAARASVEICPMETTGAIDREYSRTCVLQEE